MKTNIDAAWSFQRYQEIRHRFPDATYPDHSTQITNLSEIIDQIDAFVFDAFGVLNVGETTIPSAIDRVRALREMGKQVRVLTNAASLQPQDSYNKFVSLGYDFSSEEIISSRQVLIEYIEKQNLSGFWGCISPEGGAIDDLPINAVVFDQTRDDLDGVIFLKGAGWDFEKNKILATWFETHSVPFLIGNPDLVAPREDWFSVEPGGYAHILADQSLATPKFFGKPFENAFDAVAASLEPGTPREKVLMVGDTLHTDILGGAAAGFKTCLVTSHGVLRELDHMACIKESMIIPDFIVPTI